MIPRSTSGSSRSNVAPSNPIIRTLFDTNPPSNGEPSPRLPCIPIATGCTTPDPLIALPCANVNAAADLTAKSTSATTLAQPRAGIIFAEVCCTRAPNRPPSRAEIQVDPSTQLGNKERSGTPASEGPEGQGDDAH